MCQASPGPRCFNDSSKRVATLSNKLSNVSDQIRSAKTEMNKAATAKDFNAYAAARKNVTELETKATVLTTQIRHTQRDIDSTLTGRRQLDSELASATTSSAIKSIEQRQRAGDAIRFSREHALMLKQEARMPAIKFAS